MTQLATGTEGRLEEHRAELTGYCYRMLGSVFDADDAVQETLVRAWQKLDTFEGRSSLRSWLYRIATNVCLDHLRSRNRRALPMDLSGPRPATTPPTEVLPETTWLEPLPTDPAEAAVGRDTVRLAFVAALQHLPPRQRAVLILREVLAWHADEVALLLDTSVASVNSALQRARATMAERGLSAETVSPELSDADRALLGRYVEAFERYDIDTLVGLLHEEAGFSMPPFALWLQGIPDIRAWYLGFGSGCAGSRLVAVNANGLPAFAHYKPGEVPGRLEPWAVQVPEIEGGRIVHLHHFVDRRLFARFGVPDLMEA